MPISTTQTIKLAIVNATGLSTDALHLYAGLVIFLLSAAALRKKRSSWTPWLLALSAAVIVEIVDLRDDLVWTGHWRREDSLHDVWNTIFFPTVLMALMQARLMVLRKWTLFVPALDMDRQ